MIERKKLLLAGTLVLCALVGFGLFRGLARDAPAPASASATAAGAPGELSSVNRPDAARTPIPLDRTDPIPMTVYMSPTCGCCGLWVEHMEEYGFEAEVEYREQMGEVKEGFAIGPSIASCHTAVVNGYVVEGHVPADVVRAFLAEAPEARGLAVPGMPIGSPGMEYGDRVDPYDVLLLTSDGGTEVYASRGPGRAGAP